MKPNIFALIIVHFVSAILFTIIGILHFRPNYSNFNFRESIHVIVRRLRILKYTEIMNFAMIQFYSLGISICKYIFRVYGVITMNNIAIAFDKGSLNAKLNLLQYKSIIYNFITSTGIQCFIITSLLCYLIYKYFPLKVTFFELKPFFSFTLKTHHIKFIYLLTFISMLITIYKPTEVSESDFMQLNYVNPKDLVTFPGEKRNIIYLFLESMESTFASKQSGGLFEQSLIPNLEKLAKDKENIHFTHKEGFLGGPKQMERMSYTAGASYSMICGNYIGTPGFMTTEENEKIFHPQLTCLPDITKKFGYNNIAIYGTQWSSCKQGYVFTSHSIPYQNIIDSYAINKTDVWVRDFLMFEKAKKKILELSKEEKPFMAIMMTMDTHMPGFRCHLCNVTQHPQYDSISCSDKQVFDFINWLKKTGFL